MILLPSLPKTPYYGNLVNRQHPLNRGLVSWWLSLPLGGKGATWFDIAGKNHGTLTGTPSWQGSLSRPGGRGTLYYGSSSDYVDTALTAHYDDFSVAFWAQFLSNDTGYWLSKWAGGAETSTFTFGGDPGAGLSEFQVRTSGGVNQTVNTSSNRMRLAGLSGTLEWFRVVLTRRSSDGLACIYINGLLDNSSTLTSGALKSNTTSFKIGATSFGVSDTGRKDSIKFWSRAISASEVAADYQEERSGNPNTLNYVSTVKVFGEAGGGGGGLSIPVAMHNYRRRRVA